MLSRTGEYALRAVIHLAQNRNRWPIPGNRIAEEAGVPAKYLSKVLGDLVRIGVLLSSRGKQGGFRMARSPDKTLLMDVLAPFEQFDEQRCPFGGGRCSDQAPCLAHQRWKEVVDAEQRFLRSTTVQDVAYLPAAREAGRRRNR